MVLKLVITELTDGNVVMSEVIKSEVEMLSISVLARRIVEGAVETTGVVMTEALVTVTGTKLMFTMPTLVVNKTLSVKVSVGNITISVEVTDVRIGNITEVVGAEVINDVAAIRSVLIVSVVTKLKSSVFVIVASITILVSVLSTLGNIENTKVAVNVDDTTKFIGVTVIPVEQRSTKRRSTAAFINRHIVLPVSI